MGWCCNLVAGGAGPVTFVYSNWTALFPELANVSQAQATLYFGLAADVIDNSSCSEISSSNVQQLTDLLNLTTAHIASIFSQQTNGQPNTSGGEAAPGIVGRISNASEGSVSVALVMPDQPQQAAWWQQTRYGAMAWLIISGYIRGFYLPGPNYRPGPPQGGWGTLSGVWGGGGWRPF